MKRKLFASFEYLLLALEVVVARIDSLRGRMGESTRQVEGLFESLLAVSLG